MFHKSALLAAVALTMSIGVAHAQHKIVMTG
jgi:hypothetical protein